MTDSITRRTAIGGGLSLLLAPIFGGSPAVASPHSPLRVGLLADLTGPLAAHGKQQVQGAAFRAGALNGEHGHVMELIVRDTAGDEAKAREAVSMLLDEGVHALIGSSAPWTSRPIQEAAQASCTPLLTSSAMPGLRYVFQTGPSEAQTAGAMMVIAGPGNAGVLTLDKLGTSALQEAAAARGVTLGEPQTFALSDTDLKTQLTALAASKPDVIVVNALPPFDGMAVRDARAAGWTGPIMCPPEAANPAFHGTAGDAAEGVKAVAPWLAAPKQAPETIAHLSAMRRFAEGFEAANGPAATQAGYGADAVTLLHLAFLGHRDRKIARDQLDQMCCVGVTGVYNMTSENHAGLADDALVSMTSQGGMWTPVKS